MDKLDKVIEKGALLAKLIELSDMKLYLTKREIELRDEIKKIEEDERKNSNSYTSRYLTETVGQFFIRIKSNEESMETIWSKRRNKSIWFKKCFEVGHYGA